MLYLFIILAIGYLVGKIKFKGIALGNTGILFVAIIFGYFGFKVSSEIMELGLILFIYAVGLSVGKRFFRMFKMKGIQFIIISLVAIGSSAFFAYLFASLINIPVDLTVGLYTGALTNTPALAAAMEVVNRFSKGNIDNLTAGYGIAYPFSMVGTVLLVQFLPKILRRSVENEELEWIKKEKEVTPELLVKHFLVENSTIFEKQISSINPKRTINATISRVKRDGNVFVATSDFILKKGDTVRAVGSLEELKKLEQLLGREISILMDMETDIISLEIEIREKSCIGKKLKDLNLFENYNVVVTRLKRDDIEMTPYGNLTLEIGDILKVVGREADLKNLMRIFQGNTKSIDETNMVPFLIGLSIGVLIGHIPLNFPGGLQLKLGAAGGVFIVSLLLAHFGRIGRFYIYVPRAAINFGREIGLMLFLAGVGTTAGSSIVKILKVQGLMLFLSGAFITVIALSICLLVMVFIFKMSLPSIMGAISAVMTNPPALDAANKDSKTELVNLSYASVYPLALIFKIVAAQLILVLLS